MRTQADVVVIGAGLAGSSSAILLADQGFDVVLLEEGSYPRHKMCGEFLSPESLLVLDQCGVTDEIAKAAPRSVGSMRITGAAGGELTHALPRPGLALRRYALDEMLFRRAAEAGADCCSETRATSVRGDLAGGFTVETDGGNIASRFVVGAFGKRSLIDRVLERPALSQSTPYLAFKQYVRGGNAGDAVELHAVRKGYCGIVEVEDGSLNVCCMVHKDVLAEAGGLGELLAYLGRQNVHLGERLHGKASILDKPIAASNLAFKPRDPFWGDVCMVGDSAGMISPLCGDGMAMALHGGRMVASHASAFLKGSLSPKDVRRSYNREWRKAFSTRMRIGDVLQRMFIGPPEVTRLGLSVMNRVPALTRWLISATRG